MGDFSREAGLIPTTNPGEGTFENISSVFLSKRGGPSFRWDNMLRIKITRITSFPEKCDSGNSEVTERWGRLKAGSDDGWGLSVCHGNLRKSHVKRSLSPRRHHGSLGASTESNGYEEQLLHCPGKPLWSKESQACFSPYNPWQIWLGNQRNYYLLPQTEFS